MYKFYTILWQNFQYYRKKNSDRLCTAGQMYETYIIHQFEKKNICILLLNGQ